MKTPIDTPVQSICEDIVRGVGLGLLWEDGGPAAEAFTVDANALSPYQRVALRAALGIWDGSVPPSTAVILGLA